MKMIYCEYNEYFQKIRQKNRIVSVPILKNTCINCKYKKNCNITKLNNAKKNNDILLQSLLQIKDYLEELRQEYYKIRADIENGVYNETYTFRLIELDKVEDKSEAIIYKGEFMQIPDQYTVEEYLELFPDERYKKKLVGVHKVKRVSDVCYGLNIGEIESDLEYIKNEIRKINK